MNASRIACADTEELCGKKSEAFDVMRPKSIRLKITKKSIFWSCCQSVNTHMHGIVGPVAFTKILSGT